MSTAESIRSSDIHIGLLLLQTIVLLVLFVVFEIIFPRIVSFRFDSRSFLSRQHNTKQDRPIYFAYRVFPAVARFNRILDRLL